LLEAYEDLRVADVRDGLDAVMHHFVGSMEPSIRPLWRTRAYGIARTARYLPFRGDLPDGGAEEYWDWAKQYYGKTCPYPWEKGIQPGDFVVIDQSGVNAGLMGSMNTLGCMKKGARGFVSNGGVRDTDEVILQQVPFWSAICSQTMVQARLEFDAMQVPVACGGVQVRPGDMVVADGDGVIVVPQEAALEVAAHARREHESDKKARGHLYEALGLEKDETVQPHEGD
jgi:regulator of RNase E activity RraA